MNIITNWINFWNRKVKELSIWDLKFAQIWTAAWVLLIVKVFPQIMRISVWVFVAIIVLCAPYLIYIVFIRNKGQPVAGGDRPR